MPSPSPHRSHRGHVTTHRVRVPHDVAAFLREYPADERRAVRDELVRIGMRQMAQEGAEAARAADAGGDAGRSGSSSRRRARASSAGVAHVRGQPRDRQHGQARHQQMTRPEPGSTEWKRIITHEQRVHHESPGHGERTVTPRRDSSRSRVTAMLTESPPVTPPRATVAQPPPHRTERPKPAAWFCAFDDSGIEDSGDIPPALPREETQPNRRRQPQPHNNQHRRGQRHHDPRLDRSSVTANGKFGKRDPSYSVVVHTSAARRNSLESVDTSVLQHPCETASGSEAEDQDDDVDEDRFYDAARDDMRSDPHPVDPHMHGSQQRRHRRRRPRSANGRSDEAVWGGSSQEALRTSPPATLDAFLRRQRRREQRAKGTSPDVEIRIPKGARQDRDAEPCILGAARFLTVHSNGAPRSPGCDTMHSVSVSSASAVPAGPGQRRRSLGDTSGFLSQQPSAEAYSAAARLPDAHLGPTASAQGQRQSSSSGVDAFNVLSPNVTPGDTPSAPNGNATDFPAFAHLQQADAGITTTGSDQTVRSQQSQGPPNYSFAAPQGVNYQLHHHPHHGLPGELVRDGSHDMDGPASGVPPYMEVNGGGGADTDVAAMQAMLRLPTPLSEVPHVERSSEGTAVPQKEPSLEAEAASANEPSPEASDRVGMTMPDFGAAMDADADSDDGPPLPKGSHSTHAAGSATDNAPSAAQHQEAAGATEDDTRGDSGVLPPARDAAFARPRGLSTSSTSLRGTALDDSGSTVRLHNANRTLTPPALSVRYPALASVFASSGVGSVVTPPSGGDPYTPGGSATSFGAASFGFISVNTVASSSGMLGTPASGGGLTTSPPGLATGAQRTLQRDMRRIVNESGGRRMSRVQVAASLRMDPSGRVATSEGFTKMYRDMLLEFHSTKLPW